MRTSKPPQQHPSPPDAASTAEEAAERRLREAEQRLKEAIEELQRRQRGPPGDLHPPCDHADESCVAHAVGNLCQSFLLSYGIRVGIGILLRAFKLARLKSYSSLLDIKQLVSEKDLIVREEACRIGLLFGGFTGSYHALRCLLRKLRKKETPVNAILAGAVSGLSILALDDSSRRRTLALYLLARLAQCSYNSAKSKNKFHLWGSHWNHGDTLLFAIACAQVMYSFVMRPESLPKSYQDFIQKTGPVAAPVYRAVRDCCRGSPVDIASLSAYLSGRTSNNVKLDMFPEIIPCSIIHPDTNSCLAHNANAAKATFRKTFPLYFSLTFVPFVVLRLQKFMDAPVRTCRHAVTNAVRSTSFLSAFVGIFQGVICLHRKVALKDHKLVYWLAGGLSALSVLLEKKARRGELALYVLPRAGESLWYILVNRRLLPDIKNAEVALFCACMGGIMYYLEQEPDTMAPFLRGLIRRFLASRISNPGPSAGRSASYSYLQTLDAMKKPEEVLDNREDGTTSSEKYNLESIPGL
ncbi:Mitochondrial import inner membrane translocase subunit Tim17/Tim22/Tim23 family protein [Perilla frutescens var. hirtella]|uniref:Mitochondrial import inner membrane translocase subunit Tim17/Tim22/Tim23 family protein n=1 Tax=Perilla frutescens var. hirtella TaxID=608512 RepID=A0AAD4JCF9_PERFH|nr:Mitochondrial import inner membrane translocase subunit Tim17/Tim22/Tim23 family protein [Perilla frutescens var. frutescens]KAH6792771.1 Mitochondrial import inner membrane translocase subunit Tim17/Tim22/Tim23 family protein [Perilla frutescens var. hirtella]KAH6830856.1 Mitochondrial import inner membrane translocase subunit Tim17/Tim22/Tim23 family protein [Perilla frutescens var. hirtella]